MCKGRYSHRRFLRHNWRGWDWWATKGHYSNSCMRCGKNKYASKLGRFA